jgi:hypothetical protein
MGLTKDRPDTPSNPRSWAGPALTGPAHTLDFAAMLAFRRAAVFAAILAMTLRGLLPTGWMPNPEGMRQSALVICDMDDPSLSALSMAHMGMGQMDMSHMDMSGTSSGHKHADDGHQQPCPFAGAPHFATPNATAFLSLPSLAVQFAHPLRLAQSSTTSARYAPQAPRAPPRLA